MKRFAITLSALLLTACTASSKGVKPASPGSNEMLRAPLTLADGIEVIVSDVIIPPNATVPRHYHPGEEFLYIIEGSVVHVEEGEPESTLRAGEARVLAPEVEHAPRGTEEGARVIVFRVHPKGQPERILVEDEQ